MSRKYVLAVITILALLAAIYAPQKYLSVTTHLTATSPLNKSPSGTSRLIPLVKSVLSKGGVKVVVSLLDNLSVLEGYPHRSYSRGGLSDILIIMGPDVPYTEREIRVIRGFYHAGGALLIADELGVVNGLLRALFGAEVSEEAVQTYMAMVVYGQRPAWRAEFSFPAEVRLNVDLPSYFVSTGNLTPCAWYSTELAGSVLEHGRVLACYVEAPSRAFVISDTSLFVNKYLKGSEADRALAAAIVRWLAGSVEGGGVVRVYVDVGHYAAAKLDIPLPHIGRILAAYMESAASEAVRYAREYVVESPAPLKLAAILALTWSIYLSARRWYRARVERDEPLEGVSERSVLVYSPEYEKVKVRLRRRGRYKQLVANLYELTDLMLKKRLGLSVERLAAGEGWDSLSLYLGGDLKELRRAIEDLQRVKEYLEGRRRLMLIFRWKRKFNYYVDALNPLFKRLGYELVR